MSDVLLTLDVLRQRHPQMSANQILCRWQLWVLSLGVVLLGGSLIAWPYGTATILIGVATAIYVIHVIYRAHLLRLALVRPTVVAIADRDAVAIPDHQLPIYTILVPAYHEANVIHRTLAALEQLEYPADRLDVKVILEEDDVETAAAVAAASCRLYIDVISVPYSRPRTKPKACNVALRSARGEIVTIFDVEDRPDPLQLRRAVAAFRRLEPTVACLQAKLAYHNVNQNLITRLFTVEYLAWFSLCLPALPALGGPIPLGGTSMHIKRDVLERVGAWDSYNVTEDADLGIRLQRLGYQTAVLDSTTLEEANSDVVNWVKQRSRWYKGYLQTWLVHLRQPIRLWRQLGSAGFVGFNLILGGTPLLAALNPLFWFLTFLWFISKAGLVQTIVPGPIYYPALVGMLVGNSITIYTSLVALRVTRNPGLMLALIALPLYWLMMSVASIRAFAQLVTAPWFWEKTVHGLEKLEPIGTSFEGG